MAKRQGGIKAYFLPVSGISGDSNVGSKKLESKKAVVDEDDIVPVFDEPKAQSKLRVTGGRVSQRISPNPPKSFLSQNDSGNYEVRKRKRIVEDEDDDLEDHLEKQEQRSSKHESRTRQHPSTEPKQQNGPPPLPDRSAMREKLLGSSQCTEDGNVEETPEQVWTKKNPWTTNVRDAERRREDDPNYDPSTLYIPAAPFEKLTPFQKQFWNIKKDHFDVLLMFKKGKFYEMYDRDADIGASVLNLNYTGGGRVDMRCVGVPEQAFAKHLARLVEAGYKVGRVEQTETTNAAKKRRKSHEPAAKSQICQRALVRIVTKGTVIDTDNLASHQQRYVLAVEELVDEGTNRATVGVCYVDASENAVYVGEFEDDERRTWLETLMVLLRPKEIVINCMRVMSTAFQQITSYQRSQGVALMKTAGTLNTNVEFPSHVKEYLEEHKSAEAAMGVCRKYFQYLRIENEVFSMGNVKIQSVVRGSQLQDMDADKKHLVLDACTLSNLEIFANNHDGSERDTLFSFVDHAVTAGGKRLLRTWLAKPLYSAKAINQRLDAVDALGTLLDNTADHLEIRNLFASFGDVERGLARIHSTAAAEETVVMFDDTNKRKVIDFVKVVKGLKTGLEILDRIAHEWQRMPDCTSQILDSLLDGEESIPNDATEKLDYFFTGAFDFVEAERGEVKPPIGESGDPEYLAALGKLEDVDRELESELEMWREELGERSLRWYHRGKEGYQLEVPKKWFKPGRRIPGEFTPMSDSQTGKRFWTPRIQELYRRRVDASEGLSDQESGLFKKVLSRFDESYNCWSSIAEVVSKLDALMSSATLRKRSGHQLCRPEILENTTDRPVLILKNAYHPLVAEKMDGGTAASFVPNDTKLGGDDPMLVLLTGPNMGGKSTILRQTCIAVLMAQIGCYVPADACTITPVDRIFTRIGAQDRITRGQSTFMVEMEETAMLLNCATRNSLLVLDELGRGTSTFDGYAIAHAVVDEILTRACRTLFSTHYQFLTKEFAKHPEAAVYEMAAKVDEERKDVTFLYKFSPGVAPFSRGIHCARMANIPSTVADAADECARTFEDTVNRRIQSVAEGALLTRIFRACSDPSAELPQELISLSKDLSAL
uniref:DNA mismatch repair protein n=1 Tax=Rhodosorus marinus TaxID=101924 RepID=A0A7S3A7M2_9RHOD|mmetsp:Transcript_5376/g.22807  ORF Transcript_5376/g.22807 Transcript_5376/m.22807 type:complete len:1110 (+) Transcript_5376:19-3348(+)